MDRQALRADCSRCAALCCTVLGFARSDRFAIDKPVGTPCPNLLADLRCGIHSELRQRGFAGCTEYDCFGAGQRVTGQLFPGQDWRSEPRIAGDMGAALLIMEQLHALLWYLADAADALRLDDSGQPARAIDGGDEDAGDRPARSAGGVVADLRARVAETTDAVKELAAGSAEAIMALPVGQLQSQVDLLLEEVSAVVRARVAGQHGDDGRDEHADLDMAPVTDALRANRRAANPRAADRSGADPRAADLSGADLSGADLRGADLTGADLRGADLRGADLSRAGLQGADLRAANLSGADLRDANLSGADLRGARLAGALYLTAGQLRSARGDRHTTLPAHLGRPEHWRAEAPSRPG
jgi:hypothetical protein